MRMFTVLWTTGDAMCGKEGDFGKDGRASVRRGGG
jgi:hypothetical protein